MARMIPDYCPDDTPPEEKAIYATMRDTGGWLLRHSFGIAGHAKIGTRSPSAVVTGLERLRWPVISTRCSTPGSPAPPIVSAHSLKLAHSVTP